MPLAHDPDPTGHLGPAADPRRLADSLARRLGVPIETRETHTSWVFLTPERVFKLKRPVRFDFVDLRDAGARAEACRHELALNAELAPGIGIAVRAVVATPDGTYALADDGAPDAVDHVVEMHRFDEERTMRRLLERGDLTLDHAAEVGRRLARFHRTAERAATRVDERTRFDQNVDALLPLVEDPADVEDVLAIRRFAGAFLTAWAGVLDARFAGGSVVDGHGDVRTEHVLFSGEDVLIVDRLDIDALRDLDVADELAFLTMDLESRGGRGYVGAVLDGYAREGGVVPPARLLGYFATARALVRAKVALLPGSAGGVHEARRLLALARTDSWRARGPMLILLTGPPASGKSTLAAALAGRSSFPVLASDAVRRTLPDAGYDEAGRAAVYDELARRVDGARAVVVDATFGDPALQDAFFAALPARGDRSVLVVECTAPTDVRMARAERREREEPDALSDADAGVARVLAERFVPVPAERARGRLAVDTTAPLDVQLDEVEAWLDRLLGAGALT